MKNAHLLITTAWLAQACDDHPGRIACTVENMARLATRHRNLCVRLCNEPQRELDPETEEGHLDRALNRCEARMLAMFAHLKRVPAKLHFQHDPRGATVFLTHEDAEDTGSNRYYF